MPLALNGPRRYPRTPWLFTDIPDRLHLTRNSQQQSQLHSETIPETISRSRTNSRRLTLIQNQPDDTGTLTDSATISEQIREHELLRQKFRDAISSVGEEHYEQWAGMGPEQVLVLGESLDVVIDQLKPNGKDYRPTVVEYLTTEPPVLIL